MIASRPVGLTSGWHAKGSGFLTLVGLIVCSVLAGCGGGGSPVSSAGGNITIKGVAAPIVGSDRVGTEEVTVTGLHLGINQTRLPNGGYDVAPQAAVAVRGTTSSKVVLGVEPRLAVIAPAPPYSGGGTACGSEGIATFQLKKRGSKNYFLQYCILDETYAGLPVNPRLAQGHSQSHAVDPLSAAGGGSKGNSGIVSPSLSATEVEGLGPVYGKKPFTLEPISFLGVTVILAGGGCGVDHRQGKELTLVVALHSDQVVHEIVGCPV